MARRARRTHSPACQAKVALAAGKGEKTLAELAQQFDVHANEITTWKAQLVESAGAVFGGGSASCGPASGADPTRLHAKIGELTLERDNVFIERLWRSVKYEEVCLRAHGSLATASLGRYLTFDNIRRPHSGLDARTPDDVYFNHAPLTAAA